MKALLSMLLLFFISMSSSAALLDYDGTGLNLIDVGFEDSFVIEGATVGNPTNEQAWVASQLGTAVDWSIKSETVSYLETETSGLFAFSLEEEPDYFLIKNSQRIALFENTESLDWGVFDMSLLSSAFHLGDDYTISHVTEFDPTGGGGGGINNVPEPLPLALIGIGLLGIIATRKRA